MQALIGHAVRFRKQAGNAADATPPLPEREYASCADAVAQLQRAVEFEASQSFQSTALPTHARTHTVRATVDLDSDAPGIWTSAHGIVRLSPPEKQTVASLQAPRSAEEEAADAAECVSKSRKGVERRAAAKEARARKPKRAPKAAPASAPEDAVGNEADPGDDAAATEDSGRAAPPNSPADRGASHGGACDPSGRRRRGRLHAAWKLWRAVASHARHRETEAEAAAPSSANIIASCRVYPSPVPFVRLLQALDRCRLHPSLRDPLLRCCPTSADAIVGSEEGLVLVHGPPGTGKTTRIVSEILRCLSTADEVGRLRRILVCAPSNEAVENCYERCLSDRGISRTKAVLLCQTTKYRASAPATPPDTALGRKRGVVFCTMAGRSSRALIGIDFDACIVDEAGLATEASLWGVLRSTTRRLVLVGDHRQLRPLVTPDGAKLGLDRSTLTRLVAHGYPVEMLKTQYRMPKDVADFISELFYDGKLLSKARPDDDTGPHLHVHNVSKATCQMQDTSYRNESEARECVRIALAFLAKAGSPTDDAPSCAVLCPYSAQVQAVAALMPPDSPVRVMTIDSAQGKEFDCTVVCTVRVDPVRGAMGFWTDASRCVVAFTRCRRELHIVGCVATWATRKEPVWQRLVHMHGCANQ